MKLLLDQNLSRNLKDISPGWYEEVAHVLDFEMEQSSDIGVWEFAKEQGYCLVSKDKDFLQYSLLFGATPKLIWIALGNCSTSVIRQALIRRIRDIEAFLADSELSVLVIR